MIQARESGKDTRFIVPKTEAQPGDYNVFGGYLKDMHTRAVLLQKYADDINYDAIMEMESLLYQ